MTKFKKYALVAALVVPTVFSINNKSEASKLVLNENKASAVNVRSEASESDNIIGLIDDKTPYEIKGEKDGWFEIDFNVKDAYVGTIWFNVIDEVKVISPANLRSKDTIDSEILDVLQEG